jgi:hypothetical protein
VDQDPDPAPHQNVSVDPQYCWNPYLGFSDRAGKALQSLLWFQVGRMCPWSEMEWIGPEEVFTEPFFPH